MNNTTIAVDLAKAVFEVAISEHPGQVHERQRLSRERFPRWLAEQPPATILMEACGSAHHGPDALKDTVICPCWCRPTSSDLTCPATRPTVLMPKGCSRHFGTRTSGRSQ